MAQQTTQPQTQPTKAIDGRARTVRELLDKAKYSIDFYQREFAWQERQVQELVDDLTGKFLDYYDEEHSRHAVEHYGHYFLGSIVISHKRGLRFVVDGQQRLTTLTLLLIHLHHLQGDREDRVEVQNLVYSEKFGRKSFNMDVPDRTEVMQQLMEGVPLTTEGKSESVQNIANRYEDITDFLPEEVTEDALPFFVDWVLENVHLVEIEAYSDEDAYTIFETMNDRGLSLSLPELLKGYVLANVTREDDQRMVNSTWKEHMLALKDLGDDEDVNFFKNWLRARHADTIRPGKKGSTNKDFERIGSEFHRWVRDHKTRLGLSDSDSFVRYVSRDLDFYARQSLAIRKAAFTLTEGWESIRYNEDRRFTLQTQTILAALDPDDTPKDTKRKIGLVADFIDIWIARRAWNFRTNNYSSVKYTLFMLAKELRGRSVEGLSSYLREQLKSQKERFALQPDFRLHQQNYRQVLHFLARMSHWLDVRCGLSSNFEDLISKGNARPFEIEHIWANHYSRFEQYFPHTSEFEEHRNRIGGLVLLQRGVNQSLGDAPYEEKRDAYATNSENFLARSLHPLAYESNPSFRKFREETGLEFTPYDAFSPTEQAERQALYLRMAEWIWNPSRLDLDGVKPPVHGDLRPVQLVASTSAAKQNGARDDAQFEYFEKLLAHAAEATPLHASISAGYDNWVSASKHGQGWIYVVTKDQSRAELYIDDSDPANSKALFDALFAQKDVIEAAFGKELYWQRLDDKRACRISYSVPGGWLDKEAWPLAIERCTDSMRKLYAALAPRVIEANL